MKSPLLASFILFLASVGFAQNTVILNIDHQLDGEAFNFNQDANAPGNYSIDVDRLQYYLSGFSITHDGGQVTQLDSAIALVDAGSSDTYDLGDHSINEVEALSFYIGVGPDENHEDPALWPSGHPLAPVFPSMHWGWSAGYRFVAMEGSAEGQFGYELHSLGDNNYYAASMNMTASAASGTLQLDLTADYTKILMDLDVSSGLIDHSASSPTAALVLQNMANLVFVPTAQVGIDESQFSGIFEIGPNPSDGQVTVNCEFPVQSVYSLSVYNALGKLVIQKDVSIGGRFNLTDLPSGILNVVLTDEGRLIANRKVVVTY